VSVSVNRKTLLRSKTVTSVLIMLSVLLLVLSCPVKRFIRLNQNILASNDIGIKQKTGLTTSLRYNSSCCCSAIQKTVAAQKSVFSSHPKPDQNFSETAMQSGLDMKCFLRRSKSILADAGHKFSPPLFLQHRSLLI
jgi:hypothetical protein